MITNIFTNVNDDKPYIAKVEQFLKKNSVSCQSSFKASQFRTTPDYVTWRVTLTGRTQFTTNTQHFEYRQNVSLLPNYNLNNVLSNTEKLQQKQLIELATHYGLAVRKFGDPLNEVSKLALPSSAHIIAELLVKCSAIYCQNYPDWAQQNNLNEHNDTNLHSYQNCITTAIRVNSLFEYESLCELSEILKDF